MELNIDIAGIAQEALQAALQPEVLREKVNALVAKTVDEALSNAFRPYNEFGKSVENAIKAAIPQADAESFARLSDIVVKAVAAQVNKINDDRVERAIVPAIQKLLEPAPAEMKLSDLVAQALHCWADCYERKHSDQPTIIVESSGSVDGYHHVYMDPESGKSRYSCSTQLDINNHGEVYSLRVDDKDVQKAFYLGPMWNFDRLLFNLYTGGTKIIVDQYDFSDVYYSEEN